GFVRDHAADGRAVVLATHDVELAAAVATRVVMLAGGEPIADGTPATVLGDSHAFAPQMTRVFGPGWLTPEQVEEALACTSRRPPRRRARGDGPPSVSRVSGSRCSSRPT